MLEAVGFTVAAVAPVRRVVRGDVARLEEEAEGRRDDGVGPRAALQIVEHGAAVPLRLILQVVDELQRALFGHPAGAHDLVGHLVQGERRAEDGAGDGLDGGGRVLCAVRVRPSQEGHQLPDDIVRGVHEPATVDRGAVLGRGAAEVAQDAPQHGRRAGAVGDQRRRDAVDALVQLLDVLALRVRPLAAGLLAPVRLQAGRGRGRDGSRGQDAPHGLLQKGSGEPGAPGRPRAPVPADGRPGARTSVTTWTVVPSGSGCSI